MPIIATTVQARSATSLKNTPLWCYLMDRRKPAYDLGAIQSAAAGGMSVTTGALRGVAAMGMTRADMMRVIKGLSRRDFQKSVTSYHDHAVWMDVYHGRAEGYEFYKKIVEDMVTAFTGTSLKEK